MGKKAWTKIGKANVIIALTFNNSTWKKEGSIWSSLVL